MTPSNSTNTPMMFSSGVGFKYRSRYEINELAATITNPDRLDLRASVDCTDDEDWSL
jgi:hypothetical protein